jgi:hypothetical protein
LEVEYDVGEPQAQRGSAASTEHEPTGRRPRAAGRASAVTGRRRARCRSATRPCGAPANLGDASGTAVRALGYDPEVLGIDRMAEGVGPAEDRVSATPLPPGSGPPSASRRPPGPPLFALRPCRRPDL